MMAGMNRVLVQKTKHPIHCCLTKNGLTKKLQRESNNYIICFKTTLQQMEMMVLTMLQNTRWSFGTEWRLGYSDKHGYETETHRGRYIGRNQWLMPFI